MKDIMKKKSNEEMQLLAYEAATGILALAKEYSGSSFDTSSVIEISPLVFYRYMSTLGDRNSLALVNKWLLKDNLVIRKINSGHMLGIYRL